MLRFRKWLEVLDDQTASSQQRPMTPMQMKAQQNANQSVVKALGNVKLEKNPNPMNKTKTIQQVMQGALSTGQNLDMKDVSKSAKGIVDGLTEGIPTFLNMDNSWKNWSARKGTEIQPLISAIKPAKAVPPTVNPFQQKIQSGVVGKKSRKI